MNDFIHGAEYIFGILYIFTSKNNLFIHVTDITGKETISRVSAGIISKSKKEKKTNYSAMLGSQLIASKCKVSLIKFKSIGINALHIKIRARGGNHSRVISPVGHTVLRTFLRLGFKIGRIGK
uniref:Ribosomal protein S14 n=1 Tax=Lotharella vacuolata TaxID=74820 RepID=A0A0H5BHG5_9EUKA|nr:ribosomal protein S14 [Lotharella vacuolata]